MYRAAQSETGPASPTYFMFPLSAFGFPLRALPRLLPLLHTLVEEGRGEEVFHPLSRPFMSLGLP
jgi:hypothetical protein